MNYGTIQAAWLNVIGSITKCCGEADNRAWAETASQLDPRQIPFDWWKGLIEVIKPCGAVRPEALQQCVTDIVILAKLADESSRATAEPKITPKMPALGAVSPRRSVEAAYASHAWSEPVKSNFADHFGNLIGRRSGTASS